MKLTFKQFLEDIEVDPVAWDSFDAEREVRTKFKKLKSGQLSWDEAERNYQPLPATFPIKGFSLHYRRMGTKFNLLLVDDEKDAGAISIDFQPQQLVLPSGTLMAIEPTLLSASSSYTRKGLVVPIYELLVNSGQVLLSARLQTPGGKSVWERLMKSSQLDGEMFAAVDEYQAGKLLERNKQENTEVIERLRQKVAAAGRPDASTMDITRLPLFTRSHHFLVRSKQAASLHRLAYGEPGGPNRSEVHENRLVLLPAAEVTKQKDFIIQL